MVRKRRTSSQQAAVVEALVPRYGAHFLRMLLGELPPDARTVLDVGCGTGHSSLKLLERLGPSARVIAIDQDEGLIDLARQRGWDEIGKHLFFKVESAAKLSFGEGVFDAVVGNLVYEHLEHPATALKEMRRVLAPNSPLLLSTQLRGSFVEAFDMLAEVAVARDDSALAARVGAEVEVDPTAPILEDALRAAGFADVRIYEETFRLSFRTPAEIFQDRLIGLVALSRWRRAAGDDALLADVQRSLEVYFANGPLSLTVVAGAVVAR
ncbi:MAG: methyltransferase domain-containing protein [Myxococcota bacterium]